MKICAKKFAAISQIAVCAAAFALEEGDDIKVLEETSVTAYRFDSLPLETPINSTFIDSEKLDQSPYSNVADAIKNYGNINFRSVVGSSATGDFSMRGFGENSQTRILVLVDGQKFNRPDMGAINWLQIPLFDVESIEILRGAQSAMYGSSAEAGVIKITTLAPKENGLKYSGRISYGSYKTIDVAARAVGREGDWFFTANGGYFSSDGWRENSENQSQSGNLSLGVDLDDKNTFVLSGNFTHSSINYPGALTLEQYLEDPTQSDGNNSRALSKDGLCTATLKNKSPLGEGEVGLGWNFRDINWNLGGRSRNFQWAATFTPRYRFNLGESAHIVAGFDGTYDDLDFKKYYLDTQYTKSKAFADRTSLAPYFGGDWTPFENLSLSAVGRFETQRTCVSNTEYIDSTILPYRVVVIGGKKYTVPNPDYPAKENSSTSYDGNSIRHSGWSANFGANYKLRNDTSVFFKFDQIYHTPVMDEIAAYQGAVLPTMFNFNLRPETGQNYEVGAKYMTGNWTITGSVYLTELNDEIAYSVNSDGEWLNVNLPPTRRYGADIEARYDEERWGASVMLSAVRAYFTSGTNDGNEVPLVPNIIGSASAYVKPLEWITLSARISFLGEQYVGSDYENKVEKIPAYALLDFQANFNITREASIFLAIDNALDKRYISCAWSSGYYPGMGRMMRAGINIRF